MDLRQQEESIKHQIRSQHKLRRGQALRQPGQESLRVPPGEHHPRRDRPTRGQALGNIPDEGDALPQEPLRNRLRCVARNPLPLPLPFNLSTDPGGALKKRIPPHREAGHNPTALVPAAWSEAVQRERTSRIHHHRPARALRPSRHQAQPAIHSKATWVEVARGKPGIGMGARRLISQSPTSFRAGAKQVALALRGQHRGQEKLTRAPRERPSERCIGPAAKR